MEDQQYHDLFDQATRMQYKFHDYTAGQASHQPMARALQNEIHQLVQDISTERSPRSIEDRIKTIQRQLEQTKHVSEPFMNFNNHDDMHDNFEDMRNDVRKFTHY